MSSSEYLRHGLLFQLASLFDITEKNEFFSFYCPEASPSGRRPNCETDCLNHCAVKLREVYLAAAGNFREGAFGLRGVGKMMYTNSCYCVPTDGAVDNCSICLT